MYVNWYYLHFRDPVSVDALQEAFADDPTEIKIKEIFPAGFEITGPIPFSQIKYLLGQRFSNANFYVCKVKDAGLHEPD